MLYHTMPYTFDPKIFFEGKVREMFIDIWFSDITTVVFKLLQFSMFKIHEIIWLDDHTTILYV